jgi:hypothetical protein
MRSTPSENLAAYSSKDWRLQDIDACSDARREGSPRLSRPATRALGQTIEQAVTIE